MQDVSWHVTGYRWPGQLQSTAGGPNCASWPVHAFRVRTVRMSEFRGCCVSLMTRASTSSPPSTAVVPE